MAWFRKNDGSLQRKELDRLHRQQAAEGGEPLPEEAQSFLDKALELLLKSPAYIWHGRRVRGRRYRLINDYVSEHTVRTIREWFTVKDDDIDTSDPDIFTYVADVFVKGQEALQKVTNRLYQADVDLWVSCWLWEAERLPWKNRKVLVDDASTPQPTIPPPNGALWHRQRLAKLRTCKEEKERRAAERKQIEQLDAIANRTPIDYGSDGDALIAVEEKLIYPTFATRMRQNGFNESDVFDGLQALSELVRQFREFLPKLTAPVVQQFEARVLLSFCVRNRQARELADATAKRDDAEKECQKNIAKIHLELLNLKLDLFYTRSSTGTNWADVISSAIQEVTRSMLVR